eukprot:10868640-Ditylum_brightwellii.AAC.1
MMLTMVMMIVMTVLTSTSYISHKQETMLRGGGLKDDRGSIDNGQKDNVEKIMETQTIKVLVRGCLIVLQWPAKTHPIDLKIIPPTI